MKLDYWNSEAGRQEVTRAMASTPAAPTALGGASDWQWLADLCELAITLAKFFA